MAETLESPFLMEWVMVMSESRLMDLKSVKSLGLGVKPSAMNPSPTRLDVHDK